MTLGSKKALHAMGGRGVLGFRNLLVQNLLTKIIEMWYVALSGGPLSNLFKTVLSQGILGLLVKYT